MKQVPCPACGEAMPYFRVICDGCVPWRHTFAYSGRIRWNAEANARIKEHDARVRQAREEGEGER